MKIIRHLIGVFFIVFLLCIIYYVFFSIEKYSGQVRYVPSFTFSLSIVLCFILTILYARKIIAFKWPLSIVTGILSVALLFTSTSFVHSKYGFLLQHYYNETSYSTLLGLPNFALEKNNYFFVKRLVEKANIKVTMITEGWNEANLQVYLINNSDYIIIDWKKERIKQHYSKKEVEELFLDQVMTTNIEWITHNGKILYVVQDGQATNYVVLPSNDGFYFPTLKEYQGR